MKDRLKQSGLTRSLKTWVAIVPLCVSSLSLADTPPPPSVTNDQLTLKRVMSDPDWMGRSPEASFWSLDNSSVYYSQKALGHSHQEYSLIKLSSAGEAQGKPQLLDESAALTIAAQKASLNSSKSQGVFEFEGDIYLINIDTGNIEALTADEERQSKPRFSASDRISFLQGYKVFHYDLNRRLGTQVAEFKTENDPETDTGKSYLEQSQPRLLKYIEKTEAEKKFQQKRREANNTSANKTWFLGADKRIRTFRLSPDGGWVILGLVDNGLEGKSDHMPEFVTSDGYVNDRKVRPLVGSSKPTNETFYAFDLLTQEKHEIDLAKLPGINDDPLEDLKRNAAKKIGYKFKALDKPRSVYAYNWMVNGGVEWTSDSKKAAILLFSYDNKDRWLVGFDVNKKSLKTLDWMSDEAWINDWTFNQFGWLPDNQTLYFLSEKDGYSHLYVKKGRKRATQLTEGDYEVSDVTISDDGKFAYFKANKKHPGIYEIYRVSTKGGKVEALTNLNGVNDYVLSPDETSLLITHSTTTKMPELFVKKVGVEGAPQKLTDTMSNAFKSVSWQAPQIVAIPSRHIDRPIYSRFYKAQNNSKVGDNGKKPAVIFVHGAGYLQNSHQGWSGYFREYMFHNLLTRQGYVVLDMDYRASKGYGRDWRTAIYRQMGTPELEDLVDGADWLSKNAGVDPERIGVYGGSYGGFMTFMALFKEPDVFAAGAALRPVTDWAHYNHGYTSNILNTPEVDPEAYERSSPIEFAEGLRKPLLIAHGMVDDNVFFKDSVRLVQRLIELEKTPYFETAIYPVEPHGFKQPSSWLDEYTRIYQLFERYLN
ncbi:prolyl oligopeptidase family serine peptidase [Aliikangiella sp. G2MR2-5]|uniref:S9 family peptidase n=1 Tax=Aliikangiella sp. G2MR2-5 TaxID=2788943 RepID=UPI0018A91DED|nr:prolyl oligopeptidase family serine peptidase [Aliikangiella sp. G2MR2-5]